MVRLFRFLIFPVTTAFRSRASLQAEIVLLRNQLTVYNKGHPRPRIVGELQKLGIDVAKSTVERYWPRRDGTPSASLKAFLDSHAREMASMDFFIVPTVKLKVLFVFIVLSHDRRRIVHFFVTEHPTAQWTAQQRVEAFPFDSAPRYLLRDGESTYGFSVRQRIDSLGIADIQTAPASPWQNPYVERVIGSIGRELLGHVIVLNNRHLRRLLRQYVKYYHEWRLHRSLRMDAPDYRAERPTNLGNVVSFPAVHGLHHYYLPRAA